MINKGDVVKFAIPIGSGLPVYSNSKDNYRFAIIYHMYPNGLATILWGNGMTDTWNPNENDRVKIYQIADPETDIFGKLSEIQVAFLKMLLGGQT